MKNYPPGVCALRAFAGVEGVGWGLGTADFCRRGEEGQQGLFLFYRCGLGSLAITCIFPRVGRPRKGGGLDRPRVPATHLVLVHHLDEEG